MLLELNWWKVLNNFLYVCIGDLFITSTLWLELSPSDLSASGVPVYRLVQVDLALTSPRPRDPSRP